MLEYKLLEELFMVYRALACTCEGGVSPVVSPHMYKVARQPILTYGCSTLNVSPCIIDQFDKYQTKLIKSSLALPKCCPNSPLLKALITSRKWNEYCRFSS